MYKVSHLIEFINLTSDNGFQGLLQDISLLDFIQMSLGAGERKCLDIRDIKEQVLCWLFIKEGRFIHAEYGELQGEQAFGKIISIQRGVFFERPWKVPASFSLEDHSPQKLLMKASREKFLSGSSVEVSDELYNTIEEKLKRLS